MPSETTDSFAPFEGQDPAGGDLADGIAAQMKSIEFVSIAGTDREILITHHGQVYRLRLTRNDKLILQK